MKRRTTGEPRQVKLAPRERAPETPLRKAVRAILLAALVWVSWSAATIVYRIPEHTTVRVGEPSHRDIKAATEISYISEVRTEEIRRDAAAQIADIYTDPDVAIARAQIRSLTNYTRFATALRREQSAKPDIVARLRENSGLALSALAATRLLSLNEESWSVVVTEALRVLDLVMREELRENALDATRVRVYRSIGNSLAADQRAVTIDLVQAAIVPNSYHDVDATAAARQAARELVAPVHITLREGESILREGQIVSPLAMEKLDVLGLLETGLKWQDVVGHAMLLLVIVVGLSLFVIRSNPELLERPRRELLLALILVVVGVASRPLLPGHTILPYIFPTAVAAMLVAILLDLRLAIVVAVISAVIVGLSSDRSIEILVYALMGGLIGALTLWRMDQLGAFIGATLYLALSNMMVIVAFSLQRHSRDLVGLLQLMASGAANAALATSLTFVAFSLIGRVFGIATSLQLLELARPTHPLFRQLLMNAPGTYHHSIVISNMAERAAEAIQADALLARVGSYYHDIGKTLRPYFFAENQSDGLNPHDKLDPDTSAAIIISHAQDGLALARKFKLPERVCEFIPEHHGTTLVTYFYRRANQLSDDEDVSEDDFRYPGPRPQSKETAIVMLADSIEAWIRANRPSTQADMERVIRQVINDRLIGGQLAECELTFKDLDKMREAFASVLQGIFHPRIQYPERVTRRSNHGASAAAEPPSTSSG